MGACGGGCARGTPTSPKPQSDATLAAMARLTTDELYAVWGRAREYFVEQGLEQWQAKRGLRFDSWVGTDYSVFMHRSTIPDCGIQVTQFDEREEPWGHSCHDTPEAALAWIFDEELDRIDKENLWYDFGWDGHDMGVEFDPDGPPVGHREPNRLR